MLKDTFCSSPWFHVGIDHAGHYFPCRWIAVKPPPDHHISNTSLSEYINSDYMKDLRLKLLNGDVLDICKACHYEDQHGKVSARQKQLLKSGVNIVQFEKSLSASPHWNRFAHSADTQGHTNHQPVDLQIDIGNVCNSACIMCNPKHSSRLIAEYNKLINIEPQLFAQQKRYTNWTDDSELVEKFVNELAQIPSLRYVHFLGGETLYLKSFYTICNKLIDLGISKNISIGTTTNATIYNADLEHIIKNFKHVHLGISIETVTLLNDYIRYPADLSQVLNNINKFMQLRTGSNLQMSLRITPSILSIFHIDSIFEYMIKNNIIAESCNILNYPSQMRIELLPENLRLAVLEKIQAVINKYNLIDSDQVIINRRREDLVSPVISTVIFEYKKFIESYNVPLDVEEERYNLIRFLKAFESLRDNNILTYLPEYEEFFRTYGY